MRQGLALDFAPNAGPAPEGLSYVGLITPPRVLTLDENFPSVEEQQEDTKAQQQTMEGGKENTASHAAANGGLA